MNHSLHNRPVSLLLFASTGEIMLRIHGRSMEPAIRKDQIIRIRKSSTLLPGKCYLFPYRGRLIIHRLIHSTAKAAYFIGDRNHWIETVPPAEIIGQFTDPCTSFYRWSITILNYIFLALYRFDSPIKFLVSAVRLKSIDALYRSDDILLKLLNHNCKYQKTGVLNEKEV